MSIKKIVITKGLFQDKELRLLVSFDDNDKPIDIINLDITKVGQVHLVTVEKVLKDIDACIVKLEDGQKAFIENKKLMPEYFISRHSKEKLVCQSDQFYLQISQDKKDSKPYSGNFLRQLKANESVSSYYISNYAPEAKIITDLEEEKKNICNAHFYDDVDISLWHLYGLTSILEDICSKKVYLKNGGNILIEKTEAMTVIDVNSGKSYGKCSAMDINKEAIIELAHQFRIRSISGIIIVDLLKVSKEDEKKLIIYLKEACKDDISNVDVHGFTKLGLLEITRSKIFSPVF